MRVSDAIIGAIRRSRYGCVWGQALAGCTVIRDPLDRGSARCSDSAATFGWCSGERSRDVLGAVLAGNAHAS
jgi:hypothetical protein